MQFLGTLRAGIPKLIYAWEKEKKKDGKRFVNISEKIVIFGESSLFSTIFKLFHFIFFNLYDLILEEQTHLKIYMGKRNISLKGKYFS